MTGLTLMFERSHFYHHVAVLNFDRIDGEFRLRVIFQLPGFRIVLPAMPWANELVAFDVALAERPAHVQAYIVHSSDGAADIGDADRLAFNLEFFGFAFGGKLGFGGQFDIGHGVGTRSEIAV